MALSFEQFQATVKRVVKDADWCANWGIEHETQVVREYDNGSCFIYSNHEDYVDGFIRADSEKPSFTLILENQEWNSANLSELEKILYENWYLPVLAD